MSALAAVVRRLLLEPTPPSFSLATASTMVMAVKANTAGVVSFSLVLKPLRGDFAVRKRFDSAAAGGGGGSGSSASAADTPCSP